jgi:ABC-2 type transport system permease protein
VSLVNWEHLKAFVWLRWRLAVNQTRRSGPGGAVVSGIVTVLMTVGGGVMLILGFLVGFLALRTGPSAAVMVVWDGAIVGFVFFWLAGLMSELQRSDSLSLDRFLYLPVSPSGVFLINYLGSSVSLGLVLMLPAMTGLAAGLALSRGPGMLLIFPLVAAFFLMMTAVTYQFRGWLASMMENPRRRRTIMAVVPILFIALFQLPNMWINLGPGASERRDARRTISTLDKDLAAGRITREEYKARRPASPARDADDGYARARMVNMIAPPGWLAYGAEAVADGRVWPAVAGVFGMALIGAISLRRAYGTTLRMYRGDFDSGRRTPPSAIPAVLAGRTIAARQSIALMEWRLPWVSERVSSVAVTGFRSWMRASEMKMALFAPVMMLIVFTRMFAGEGGTASDLRRPLMTSSLAGLVLILGLVGPIGNQFGYDRAGFLAFVLGPVPRRDVLMGKNLSVLPFALVMMIVLVALRQWLNPMRLDHLVALLFQLVSMYLLFCLAGNLLSIIGPLALKPGSGMPAGHQGIRSFGPLLLMVVSPMLLGLTLMPLGIEALLSALNWFAWFPAYLVLGVVQVVVMIWLYRLVLDWEGGLLQRREPEILEIVGSRIE